MKKIIKTYKYEKIEVSGTEIEIPEEPMYVFQTSIRRAIRIIPQWTTWNKERFQKDEEIWRLQVTCVYTGETKVEQFHIQLIQLEGITNNEKDHYNIGRMLLYKDYALRNKEQFEADLQRTLDQINNESED